MNILKVLFFIWLFFDSNLCVSQISLSVGTNILYNGDVKFNSNRVKDIYKNVDFCIKYQFGDKLNVSFNRVTNFYNFTYYSVEDLYVGLTKYSYFKSYNLELGYKLYEFKKLDLTTSVGVGRAKYDYGEIAGIHDTEIINFNIIESGLIHPTISVNANFFINDCIIISLNPRIHLSSKFNSSQLLIVGSIGFRFKKKNSEAHN